MTFSREEIAVHCLASLLTRDGYDGAGAARDAVVAADALLLALTPTPAPVAPPAGKYVPAVGDIVIGLFGDDGLARVDSVDPTRWSALCDGTWRSGFRFGVTSTARLATDAEKRAAGLAVPPPATAGEDGENQRGEENGDRPPPAPEAKRPEWVTYEVVPGCRSNPYAVLRWDENGSPVVGPPDRSWALREWEPCAAPCPPPVAGRVGCDKEYAELVRAARLTVERIEHFGSVSSVETLRGALKDLDIALSRPVRP